MKRLLVFLALVVCLLPELSSAQSGMQDSVLGGELRPRRDTYIIETFPSPARRGQTITIRYYNHNPETTSLRICDVGGRLIQELQEQKLVANGIHEFTFRTSLYASGSYHIYLRRYSSDGTELSVEDSRFIVVH